MRPMGLWSISMTLSMASSPSTRSCAPGSSRAPNRARARARYRMSVTSVLLPEPETPVTAVNVPSGKRTSRSCRLWARAPTTSSARPLPVRRRAGMGTLRSPRRYAPVIERGSARIASSGALGDDLAAVLAGAGTDVDDPVGRADRLLVVLHDQQRVAQVAQPREGGDQLGVVALVQPDGRLVEDVQHAHQARADLGRQPDALGLAARQGVAGAVDRQVVQAHVDQEAQAGA